MGMSMDHTVVRSSSAGFLQSWFEKPKSLKIFRAGQGIYAVTAQPRPWITEVSMHPSPWPGPRSGRVDNNILHTVLSYFRWPWPKKSFTGDTRLDSKGLEPQPLKGRQRTHYCVLSTDLQAGKQL